MLPADHIAAEVVGIVDGLLIHHASVAGLVIRPEEFFAVIHVVHIAPTAAVHRFEEPVFADAGKNRFPVQRILEVAD